MKKALTQTIIVFVAVNLITAGFALAQNAPDEASREEAIAARKQAEVARVEAEIAAKVAQKEAEVAEKQMQAAQKQMEAAQKELQVQLKQLLDAQTQAKIFPSPPDITTTATTSRFRIPAYPHSGGAVLVVPAVELKVEDLAAITEDMTVMSRIFDNKLSQAQLTSGRGSWFGGFDPFFGRGSGAIEAIYLEGYGALFLMKVNVLLSPPPEDQQEKETKEEDTDPLWTQMRQEMYAPLANTRRTRDRSEEKYDAEKVEDLKETLIKTLKHAANIRALKPDESVILTVIGKAGMPAIDRYRMITTTGQMVVHYKDDNVTRILQSPGDLGFSAPTVLTIRAKKLDIDAFAKGQLSFDQFSQKMQLFSYSYLGGNISAEPSPPTEVGIYNSRSRRSRISR